jgi:dolichol-phosphate mannosyltransferase
MAELSIIIPCLNEEENVGVIIQRLSDLCAEFHLDAETIIVDDASDDSTFFISSRLPSNYPILNIKVLRRFSPRRGYGAVVRYGVANATGKYCIVVAADNVDPIHLIPVFLEHMRGGAKLVQCSRYMNKIDSQNIPLKYKFYHIIYRFLVRILLKKQISDTTYAFKMFDRIQIMGLGLSSNRFSISPEITFKFLLSDSKVIFIPANQGMRQQNISKFIFRREGYGYIYVLLRAWLHRLGILWF